MEIKSARELCNWADEAKMWKKKVEKAKNDYEEGKCSLEEYNRILDASTTFSKDMIRALS